MVGFLASSFLRGEIEANENGFAVETLGVDVDINGCDFLGVIKAYFL